MSDSDRVPDEPAPPEIAPALLRATAPEPVAEPAPEVPVSSAPDVPPTAESGAPAAEAPQAPPAAEAAAPEPGASLDDPELPGVPLGTRIEALLFVATEPLPLKRIKELVRVEDGRAVREAIDALAAVYAAKAHAVRIEEVAGGFRLRTTQEVAPIVARLGRRPEPEKLSPAALETLAIIAYRQPVLRADVERIRGVASGEVLRALVERNLVRVAGRAELPGSPLYYGTTTRFLEIFGLRDLADLPRDAEALRPQT